MSHAVVVVDDDTWTSSLIWQARVRRLRHEHKFETTNADAECIALQRCARALAPLSFKLCSSSSSSSSSAHGRPAHPFFLGRDEAKLDASIAKLREAEAAWEEDTTRRSYIGIRQVRDGATKRERRLGYLSGVLANMKAEAASLGQVCGDTSTSGSYACLTPCVLLLTWSPP